MGAELSQSPKDSAEPQSRFGMSATSPTAVDGSCEQDAYQRGREHVGTLVLGNGAQAVEEGVL